MDITTVDKESFATAKAEFAYLGSQRTQRFLVVTEKSENHQIWILPQLLRKKSKIRRIQVIQNIEVNEDITRFIFMVIVILVMNMANRKVADIEMFLLTRTACPDVKYSTLSLVQPCSYILNGRVKWIKGIFLAQSWKESIIKYILLVVCFLN